MSQCAKCGACTTVCPLYQATGRESAAARGKLHLLEKLSPESASAEYAEILSQCLLCGACSATCPRGLDPAGQIARARSRLSRHGGKHSFQRYLSEKILHSPFLLKAAASSLPLLHLLPEDSGLRLRLGLFPADKNAGFHPPERNTLSCHHRFPPGEEPPLSLNYFAGCYARYFTPQIMAAHEVLLRKIGKAAFFPEGQVCCGLAGHAAGDIASAKKLARRNISAFSTNSLPILTTCASCYKHLSSYPELFEGDPDWQSQAQEFSERLLEFSSFFSTQPEIEKILQNSLPNEFPTKKILYHDPCHLRFGPAITAAPRKLLSLLPSYTLVELPHGPQCCGHGGLFHLSQPELSNKILTSLLRDSIALDAEVVVSTCTGCILHWQEGLRLQRKTASVKHLAVLLAENL